MVSFKHDFSVTYTHLIVKLEKVGNTENLHFRCKKIKSFALCNLRHIYRYSFATEGYFHTHTTFDKRGRQAQNFQMDSTFCCFTQHHYIDKLTAVKSIYRTPLRPVYGCNFVGWDCHHSAGNKPMTAGYPVSIRSISS